MNDYQNLIARHAYIRAGVQRDFQAGRKTPQHILNELQSIEARAQATLTPMELQQAQAASKSMEAQYLHQADMQAGMHEANMRGYYTEKVARDLTGMTPDQLLLAKEGKPIPVKGKGAQINKMRENVEGMFKQYGIKKSFEEIDKLSTRYEEERKGRGNPNKWLNDTFGDKAKQAAALLGAYEQSGIGYEAALIGEPEKDHYVKPTDDLQRSTQIADSWARSAKDNDQAFKSLTTDIHPDYLEDDGARGDIARAFVQHEAEETAYEREGWESPSYDIEESDDGDFQYASSV
jgi:hypothetical protein